MGYKLAAQLPHAKLVIAPETMHSLHLERPQKAVSLDPPVCRSGQPVSRNSRSRSTVTAE